MAEREITVSVAGDYAAMKSGQMDFYYGYEYVWCEAHKKFAASCGDDCPTEWAFTVSRKGAVFIQYRKQSSIDGFDVQGQLLFGLGRFITENMDFLHV